MIMKKWHNLSSTMIINIFFWDFNLRLIFGYILGPIKHRKKNFREQSIEYILSRFNSVIPQLKFLLAYFVNEILGNNFETLARSTPEWSCRTKWTKNELLMDVSVKFIILNKIKVWVMLKICVVEITHIFENI